MSNKLAAIDPRIDVARAGYFKRADAGNRSESRHQLFSGLARRFAQAFRQLECQRQSIFSEGDLRWLLDDDVLQLELMILAEPGTYTLSKKLLQLKVQG